MLRAGELEGVPPEESEGRGWKIPAYVVHDRDRPPRIERRQEPLEGPERVRTLEERMEALHERIESLQHDLGRARERAELTELAQSTLREQLSRERARADQERERAKRLQAELEEARRPWWRKVFGN